MKEITGVVEKGVVKLPSAIHLPDGLTVKVIWEDKNETAKKPYDREGLTEEDLDSDLQWATGKRFPE